jgi:hypothetical protein
MKLALIALGFAWNGKTYPVGDKHPSNWRIASIAADDALILPHRANLLGRNFRERQE